MKRLSGKQIYDQADFYDMEFAARHEDLDFYRDFALRTEGPILEIACGTGRITVPVAKLGRPTFGLDLSGAMLTNARKRASEDSVQITWIRANATSFTLQSRFGFIYMATNALQHVQKSVDVQKILRNVKRHLRPRGLFVFDVFNPSIHKLARPKTHRYLQKTFKLPNGSRMSVEARSHYEAAKQRLHFELFYSQGKKRNLLVKKVAMRCFFPQELDALLTSEGLRIKKKWGSFKGEPFQSTSPKQIYICH